MLLLRILSDSICIKGPKVKLVKIHTNFTKKDYRCEPWNVNLNISLRYSTRMYIAILIYKISLVMLTFYISQSWSNISKFNDTVCHGDGVSASIASSALNMASTYFGRTLGWLGRKLTQWRIKKLKAQIVQQEYLHWKTLRKRSCTNQKMSEKQHLIDEIFFHISFTIIRIFVGFIFSRNYKVTVKYSSFCRTQVFLQIWTTSTLY